MTVRVDPFLARGGDVARLADIIARGDFALHNVAESLKSIIRDGTWREFTTKLGKAVRHERFVDFITELPLGGLGTDAKTLGRIVADDPEALSMLDEAIRNRPSAHANRRGTEVGGTTRAAALRRLRKDAPDLHSEVVAGRITAHAAAVAAGFRPRTFSVRADDMDRAAATLRRNLGPDQLSTLARLLLEG